jgi:hypothetical protein
MNFAAASIAPSYARGATSLLDDADDDSGLTLLDESWRGRQRDRRRRSASSRTFENSVAKHAVSGRHETTTQSDFGTSALATLDGVVSPAFGELLRVIGRPTSEAALTFLFRVAFAIQEMGLEGTPMPLVVGLEDGGATTLEWILPTARLAFAFETDGTASYSLWTAGGDQDVGVIDTQTPVADLLRNASR